MSTTVVDPTETPAAGGDETELAATWTRPPGVVGWLSAVNHKRVGLRFIVTALVFLLIGGIEALIIRIQLVGPEAGVVSAEAYNEIFTLHGSTMMFLFAVPVLEGLAMYLLPLMLGARDMPFPRLNAFGYWSYLFGGLILYASIFAGEVPDGGWFAYVPLTGPEFSPGKNLDFWLLGVTFVEVSGIVGAIELIVLILKNRAPGMGLDRLPLFGWATLAMAFMMLFAFTTLATASVLLELERTVGWPFFDVDRGGEPLLWQHLFWIFGHPEVYIMLLPATGIVSMVVPTFARRPIVGYTYIVIALVAISFVSFGLWVHHMFTVGIPFLTMSFFTAASMLISIPSGIQIFAWLATLWRGAIRWATPLLFVVGFVVIFVAGGITGVMVAMVPFDWQAHDSFFVVAHFHYVLVGGVVFPVFGGLHYWWPKITGRMPSEALGRVSFWTMFVGFNVAFFPQHIVGLLGMPRRVATYEAGLGWGIYNLISTIGALVLALGILVFAVNLVRAWVAGPPAGADPWGAGSLEWATASPPDAYNFEHLPVVASRDPLWEPATPTGATASLRRDLAVPHDGRRESWSTSLLDAEPEEIVLFPGPTPTPLLVAIAIAVALVGLLADVAVLSLGAVVIAGVLTAWWLWPSPVEAHQEALEAEEPLRARAPTRRTGTRVAGQWGTILFGLVLLTVVGTLHFAYLRLLTTAPQWPPSGRALPDLVWPALAAVLLLVALVASWWARSETGGGLGAPVTGLTVAAAAGASAALVVALQWRDMSIVPDRHAFDAATAVLLAATIAAATLAVVASILVLALLLVQRRRGHPDVPLRVAASLWGFVAVGGVAALATTALVPRLL